MTRDILKCYMEPYTTTSIQKEVFMTRDVLKCYMEPYITSGLRKVMFMTRDVLKCYQSIIIYFEYLVYIAHKHSINSHLKCNSKQEKRKIV